MPVVTATLSIPDTELDWSFSRSSGPGGQNVNKVSSKATLFWDVAQSPSLPNVVRQRFLEAFGNKINKQGQLVLSSQRFRDQPRNVRACLEKLQELLTLVESPPRRRKKTRPPRSATERRLSDKQAQAEKKQRRQSLRSDRSRGGEDF
jgi:ribosome-associated protein